MSTLLTLPHRTAIGDSFLEGWIVTGPPAPLSTGVLVPVEKVEGGTPGRARVHWPCQTGRAARRRLEGAAQFLESRPHPGIIPLLDAGEGEGGAIVHVMAEAPGGDIQSRGLPLPWRRALDVIAAVAVALGAAHARGVLHRDVAPGNILVGPEGALWLGDWDSGHFYPTEPGGAESAPLGTPGFMSPEQEVGDPLDPRADVFALGMTLRALLLGRPPFPEGTPVPERYARLMAGDFPAPSKANPDCPPTVDALVGWMTEPDPGGRPSDGDAAARAVSEVLR